MSYSFITSCVDAFGDDISEMTSISEDISADKFLKIAREGGFLDDILSGFGYQEMGQSLNKTARSAFKDDWSISYSISYYQGYPCVYMRHSAIEHIWIDNAQKYERLSEDESNERQRIISCLTDDIDESEATDRNKSEKERNKALVSFISNNLDKMKEYRIPASSLFTYNHGFGDKFSSILKKYDKIIIKDLAASKEKSSSFDY